METAQDSVSDNIAFADDDEDIEEDEATAKARRLAAAVPCTSCHGYRLKPESLSYRLGRWNIGELCALSLLDFGPAIASLELTDREKTIGGRLLREIQERSGFLCSVGVGYLSISRSAQKPLWR